MRLTKLIRNCRMHSLQYPERLSQSETKYRAKPPAKKYPITQQRDCRERSNVVGLERLELHSRIGYYNL